MTSPILNNNLQRKLQESRGTPWLSCFSWEQRKLGEISDKVTEKNTGLQYVETLTNSAEFGVICQRDFFDHSISKIDSLHGYYIVRNEDFVYNPRISVTAPVGPVNRNKLGRNGVMSPLYTVFRPHDIDNTYLEHFFKSRYWHSYMNFNGDSGARSDRFSIKDELFFQMPIPTPHIEEQRKIGEYLTSLDDLITLHQRNILVCFLQDARNTPTWEQRKVGDIADRFDNLRIPVAANLRISGTTPYYGANGVQDYVDGYTHDGEFVLVAEDGANDLKNYPVKCVKGRIWVNNHAHVLQGKVNRCDNQFLAYSINQADVESLLVGGGRAKLNAETMMGIELMFPSMDEQRRIGELILFLDNLITLHQREPILLIKEKNKMLKEVNRADLFCEYYAKWITVYKQGAIRKVTMDKYLMTHSWLEKLVPKLKIGDLNRIAYQQILNDYAQYHERQTTMDFHHQLKGAIMDAVDEGLIERDPTRKAIIKGKTPTVKKIKFINQFELHTLLASLKLGKEVSWDWFILLVAKTGMRFSEALAVTPKDFDFAHQTLSISKTWDYKNKGGFSPTKNKSSVRKIQIDWQTVIQFSELIKGLPEDKPIFVEQAVYNSTANDILCRYCKRVNVPVISIHGLRHTHASLLLFAGVSIASVARRLGHASMTTTQKTYLHIIQELENKDVDLVMRSLSGLS